ncbi:hypothetical protein D6817_01450 [Candidatus Pacearchaeota archaeon]|nr:MAG: hypothetical protein D6817_01450 [Candidatus Pacearchaeota archaeon]
MCIYTFVERFVGLVRESALEVRRAQVFAFYSALTRSARFPNRRFLKVRGLRVLTWHLNLARM